MTVHITRLRNGMRVVTHAMPAVESVSVGVWVAAGTRHERAEANGVAHLLEHMAFKGTQRRSAADIAEEIEAVGGHLNAYTSRESTVYYAKVLREDLGLALDLLADILLNATFAPEELTRERTVVLQEIGQVHDTPDDVVFDFFQSTAFPDQAIGRPVLGHAEIVRDMSREAILDYRSAAYAADRMVLAAAGKVEHEAIVDAAARLFDGVTAAGNLSAEPATYRGGGFRDDRDLEQLHLVLGFPGVAYADEDFHAATVLSTLLGGGMSSRLFQEIRERRGLVYSIYTFGSYYADSGLFGIYAGTGYKEVTELVPAVCQEILRLPETVRDSELQRARNQLKAGTLMSLESTGARCDQLGQQTLAFGAPIPLDEQVRLIEAVDREAIARVAHRLFSGRPTVAALGPVDCLPDYDEIAGLLSV